MRYRLDLSLSLVVGAGSGGVQGSPLRHLCQWAGLTGG